MHDIRSYLGTILENLNRADALTELNPKEHGNYVYLSCPSCRQNTAYISQNGYNINCNRKNNCGYVNGLVEYITERDSVNEEVVIRSLANLANTQLPELSEEEIIEFRKIRAKERLLKDIFSISKSGLWKYGGKVVKYLRERGYTDLEIITMDFGFLPQINELDKLMKTKGHDPILISETISSFNHTNNPLLIPIYNPYGTLDGFIARAIDSKAENKYLYSKGLDRGKYFLNIHESKRAETLIIVEGIIDALLLTQRGIQGVVACGSNAPTIEQINNALKSGKVKNVVLCLDNDDAGKKGTEKSIELLKKKKLKIYVANTNPYKDPDELVKSKGIDVFIDILKHAERWEKWSSMMILNKYDINTDLERDKALDELFRLEHDITDPLESENIIKLITDNLGYSIDTINYLILSYHEKLAIEKQALSYKELVRTANKMVREENYGELGDLLTDGVAKTKALSIKNIVTPYPTETAKSDIQNRHEGLETGYKSIDKYLTIPNGAITLVAGRPSHGKTTFLLNLLLNMIEKYPSKSFYFFSYEESKTALYVKLITILSNIIVNESLKYKNSQQIEYYIKNNYTDNTRINTAISTYDKYVNEGRLWLIDNPLDVNILAGVLENITYKNDVGAVFIDYAQRIKYIGKYDSERVKIARISETLREISTRLDIPLIIGAQLNRENAKLRPQLDNLKEAGHLEEDANVVIGLYNLKTAIEKEKADEETKEGKKKALKNCKGGNVSIVDHAIDLEVHILKNRNGSINENALLSFNAPTLKIIEPENKIRSSEF